MDGYIQALKELTQAFKHLQAARDHLPPDSALKTSFESCMQFLAVLIADVQEKTSRPD